MSKLAIVWLGVSLGLSNIVYAESTTLKDVQLNKNCSNQLLIDAFRCGKFTGKSHTLYYSTHNAYFVQNLNQDTISTGGFVKYETANFLGVRLGISYAGQRRLDEKDSSKNEVSELSPEKDGLAEAYLDWKNEGLSFRVGQQSLDIPFVGNYDWRIMPVLYRALDFKYENKQDFIRLTALDRFKSYADDQFEKGSRYSKDIETDGMWSVGFGKGVDVGDQRYVGQVWYQSYDNYNYIAYTEGHVKFENVTYQPDVGIQLMYSKDQGKAQAGKVDHQGIGISLVLNLFDKMNLTSAYNYIKPNKNSYLNGALFAPYMFYTASGPYFAQPFFTSTQDLGAGHATSIALEGSITEQAYVGARYSFMNLKEAEHLKNLNQSEYILYGIYSFSGALKGWSLSNFAGVVTSSREDKTFLQNRFGLTYQF